MSTENTPHEILLLETLRVSDGRFCLPDLHRDRMERACRELYGCAAPALALSPEDVPEAMRSGEVKCRVTYGREIRRIEYEPYTPRPVRSLKIVRDDTLDYHLKYACRDRLAALASLRGDADGVIIVKDGYVTDASYANLIFRAGTKLLTPARPLLEGVMRRRLLELGIITEAHISPEMILPGNRDGISEVTLINAMLPLGALPPVPVERISR